MTLGDRIRVLRLQAGLSARALDRLIGKAQGYTSLVESSVRPRIGADVAERIACVLGCSLDWLISGLGSPPSKSKILDAVARAQAA